MARAPVQPVEYGIPVDRPTDITRPCLKLLRELLADPQLAFKGTPLSSVGSPGEIFLTSTSATQAFASENYPAIRLLSKEALTFWIALALTFVRDGQLRMNSANLIVFEGMASNPTKTPLLRAEWHEWNTQSSHAQPHWHVYSSALGEFLSKVPEAFLVEPPVLEFGINSASTARAQSIETSPFHYAMSAAWHVERGTCQERLTATSSLINWLHGCIKYTRDQLDYITK
jgi:hypothetical protein